MVSLAIGFYLKKKKYFVQIIAWQNPAELQADGNIMFSTNHIFLSKLFQRGRHASLLKRL